jgi:Domain of unknown function (DUF222)/HNH endonuclease
MLLGEVHELIDAIAAFDPATASLDSAKESLVCVTRVRSWLDARVIAMTKVVKATSSFPEDDLGKATRTGHKAAAATMRRATTAEAVPEIGEALANGSVTAGHIDAATRALGQLEPAQQEQFADTVAKLVPVAERTNPDQFEKILKREIEMQRLVDGEKRLERQRAQARVRSWNDPTTGMWHIHGEFDPETGMKLHAKIEAMLASKFAEHTPEGCPTDPGSKQDWLRAQAVIAIFDGESVRSGAPETVVVVDTRTGIVRWPLDVVLPDSAVQRFVERSKIHFVDAHGHRINWAPGELNLGRTTRLANAAQRRAMRALYSTCAVPGCEVKFDYTKLHHVIWWRNEGPTDFANLLPLCQRHHQQVHQLVLALHLSVDRTLTVTGPDGATMTTGPPTERAA